jgi:ribonuclease D
VTVVVAEDSVHRGCSGFSRFLPYHTSVIADPPVCLPVCPPVCLDTGRVIIPTTQAEIAAIARRWSRGQVQPIALDLECAASPTVPNGSGLHPHLGTIRLAQLAIADGEAGPEAVVIDCHQFDLTPMLDLIADPNWPTLVHFAAMESRWLGWCYGIEIGGLIDTHVWSRHSEPDLNTHSLGAVAERVLECTLDKTCQASAWDAPRLSDEQLRYAANDVFVLLDLWTIIAPTLDDAAEQAIIQARTKHHELARRVAAAPKGCESERALRMINATRTEPELERIIAALPYLRLHHSARARVQRALRRTRRRLDRGEVGRRPVKVEIASWTAPF